MTLCPPRLNDVNNTAQRADPPLLVKLHGLPNKRPAPDVAKVTLPVGVVCPPTPRPRPSPCTPLHRRGQTYSASSEPWSSWQPCSRRSARSRHSRRPCTDGSMDTPRRLADDPRR